MTARVLVVDNDAEMLAMLRRHLEGEGFAVTVAANGRRALEALDGAPVDVVLTDLIMTGVGGLEVLAAAQRRRPTRAVILMTAFGSIETAIEAMQQGAYDYLTKPFKLDEVTLAVRRALDDHRAAEENARLRARGRAPVRARSGCSARSRAMQRGRRARSAPSRPATRRCCCSARAAPARSSWRARSTGRARGAPAPSCR